MCACVSVCALSRAELCQPGSLRDWVQDSEPKMFLYHCCKAASGYIKQETGHFLHGCVLCLTQYDQKVPRSDLELLQNLRQSQHDKRVGELHIWIKTEGTRFVQPWEEEVSGNLIIIFQYLMVVIKKRKVLSSQGWTVRRQEAMGTTGFKRNSTWI